MVILWGLVGMVKIKNNRVYCERCKRWWFSTTLAKTGQLPSFCSLCHSPSWSVKKRRRVN
jgi:hypothetical protein